MDTLGMQKTNNSHPQKMTVLFMGVVIDQGYTQGPGKADYLDTKCQRAHNPCPLHVTECLQQLDQNAEYRDYTPEWGIIIGLSWLRNHWTCIGKPDSGMMKWLLS